MGLHDLNIANEQPLMSSMGNAHEVGAESSADEASRTKKSLLIFNYVKSFYDIEFPQSSLFSASTMIRQVPRCFLRAPVTPLRSIPTRRFLSTAPPAQKSRSWKNRATRLGLAVGVIYYYNTSTLFAEEPPCSSPQNPCGDFPRLTVLSPSRSSSPQLTR